MRVSLRQVVSLVAGIGLGVVPMRVARAGASSNKVVEGGTIAIPMSSPAVRALKSSTECPRTRQTPERRVGRVLLKTPTQQRA